MSEPEKSNLFRKKSLEAAMSPEHLNDYLRTTTPGAWLTLAAIIALLAGAVLWGVFGHIYTTQRVTVEAADGKAVCYMPGAIAGDVMAYGVVTLEGADCPLDLSVEPAALRLSKDTPALLLQAGELHVGDEVLLIPLRTDLDDGIYAGDARIEELRPISLLLR